MAASSDPCPRCGGGLGRRKDDNIGALGDRLSEYRGKTEPVIAFYEELGILRRIDGNQAVEHVFAEVRAALDGQRTSGAVKN